MLALARYTLKSPFHAATMVGVLAVLSLFIPLLSILSGALVSLIILTQGINSGLRVIAVAVIGITALTFVFTKSALVGISIGLVQWLPLVILAEVLRRGRSLSLTLVVGMALALVAVALQYLLWPNAEQTFMTMLTVMFGDLQQQPGIDADQVQAAVANMVHWMTVMLMAVMYSMFVATLMAGRWFQNRLYEQTAVKEEFYTIRLGKSAALAAVALAVASVVLPMDWLMAMAMVALATFLYQGLAVAHCWSNRYKKTSWLVLLYVLMVIFPHALALVAVLGVVDNWSDFRARFKSVPENIDD